MSEFTQRVTRTTTRWQLSVTSPYIEAYNDAYESFKTALDDQKEADKDQAELFAGICSILTTSAIMAAIASRPLRAFAKQIGRSTLSVDNLRRINSFYLGASKQPIVAFAFGGSLDLMDDTGKKIAAKLIQNTASGVSSPLPVSRREQLNRLVGFQGLAIEDYAVSVEADRSISLEERTRILDGLGRSAFMQGPGNPLKPEVLAPLIELGLFMQLVLDTDYMLHHYPVGARMAPERAGGIGARPSDPGYPRSEPSSGMRSYNTVEVDRPGFKIQEAIDKAHKKVCGKPFYDAGRYFGMLQSPFGKSAELVKAEAVLTDLSQKTRPHSLAEVRVSFP